MIYSVWNQAAEKYDYYESPTADAEYNAPAPRHLRPTTKLGATPSTAGWPLPSNARKVGSGDYARGRIASRGGGGALGLVPFLPVSIGEAAVIAVVGWWLWRRR